MEIVITLGIALVLLLAAPQIIEYIERAVTAPVRWFRRLRYDGRRRSTSGRAPWVRQFDTTGWHPVASTWDDTAERHAYRSCYCYMPGYSCGQVPCPCTPNILDVESEVK